MTNIAWDQQEIAYEDFKADIKLEGGEVDIETEDTETDESSIVEPYGSRTGNHH